MFQGIEKSHTDTINGMYRYPGKDPCLMFYIETNVQWRDLIGDSECIEALALCYRRSNRNVSKNIALYYIWLLREVYGFELKNGLSNKFREYFYYHASAIEARNPNLKFSINYSHSVQHYFNLLSK